MIDAAPHRFGDLLPSPRILLGAGPTTTPAGVDDSLGASGIGRI